MNSNEGIRMCKKRKKTRKELFIFFQQQIIFCFHCKKGISFKKFPTFKLLSATLHKILEIWGLPKIVFLEKRGSILIRGPPNGLISEASYDIDF